MSDLLLQTKLFKPALRPSLIKRTQLIAQLNAGLGFIPHGFSTRLTLVSAPAGFGKTTLVAVWLAQLATIDPQFSSEQAAWLSLDENDNDPVRFLSYFIAALQTAVPEIGEEAIRYLKSPEPPTAETIFTLLVNEINQNNRALILILDDYHLINTPVIHKALAFLLDNLPPTLHLLITTRSDPPLSLSRLRARGQIVEIRADQLRLSSDEARTFLNQVMGLALSGPQTAALEQRTEGWIAGLQLAALSLKDPVGRKERIAAFTGSHHFIIDYLTEEVLSQESSSVRNFLLSTSILERVCGPLADALMQSETGQDMLEYLEHSNLFLTPLDDDRHWFRYHPLFADVLRQRLQQEHGAILPELHHRAREWLERNGLVHEAVNQALAGSEFEEAARLIEQVQSDIWQSGENKTLQGWLAKMPAASWRIHPRLWLVQAWTAMTIGDFSDADAKLRGAEESLAMLDMEAARDLQPEVLAFRACYASLIEDPQAVELAHQALVALPKDYWLRGLLVVFLGVAHYAKGDLDAASDVLRQAPDPSPATYITTPHQIHLLAYGGLVQLAKGRLNEAWSLIQQALELAEPGGKPILYTGTLLAYASASFVLYEWGELDQVEEYLNRSHAGALEFGSAEIQVTILSELAQLCIARDDLVAAANYYDQVDALLRTHTFRTRIMAIVDYHRFQLLLKQGDLSAAAEWAASHDHPATPLNPYTLHQLALPQLLISQGRFEDALYELAALIQDAQKTGHNTLLIKALVLQALALQGSGSNSQALNTIERAEALGEPEGFVRAFVDEGEPLRALLVDYRKLLSRKSANGSDDRSRRLLAYTNKLLAAFPPAGTSEPLRLDPLLDPLTGRELEVLHLIAAGASNREIANTLVVAVPTVKKHVSNILSKLHAASRTQAVAEARTLGLL